MVIFSGCGTLKTLTSPGIVKVLPHCLDASGNHSDGPTLLHRDVYQRKLRTNPDLVHGVRYDVNWWGGGDVVLRLGMRTPKIHRFIQRKTNEKIEQKKIEKFDVDGDGKLSDEEMSDKEAIKIFNEGMSQPEQRQVFLQEIIKFIIHDLPADVILQLDTMTLVIEKGPASTGIGAQWASILLDGKTYRHLGQPEAWRVSIWRGEEMLDEQASLLW